MKKLFFAAIFFSNVAGIKAQNQDTELLLYNVGLGGITSGLGAVINHKKGEKTFKVFWRAFKEGCVGGSLMYAGKKISYRINKNSELWWGWPSKIVHSYGATIIENAARNESQVFNKLSFPVGFLRFNFELKNKIKFRVQFQPLSATAFVYDMTSSKLQLKESLLLGTPFFKYDFYNGWAGFADNNVVSYTDRFGDNFFAIAAHEHIHILQIREYLVFNSWLEKPFNNIFKPGSKLKNALRSIYADIPYNYLFYRIISTKGMYHYKIFFEFEAERFATNRYVKRNY